MGNKGTVYAFDISKRRMGGEITERKGLGVCVPVFMYVCVCVCLCVHVCVCVPVL